jgi:hypothetical protein
MPNPESPSSKYHASMQHELGAGPYSQGWDIPRRKLEK